MITTEQKKLKSVLLVDDNEIDNFINRKILEACGVTNIMIFTCTTSALNYLKQASTLPQVILLDIRFSIIDGFEFLGEFRKLEIIKYPIDIFILSSTVNPIDIETAQKKCAGFIEKPLTTEKLHHYIIKN